MPDAYGGYPAYYARAVNYFLKFHDPTHVVSIFIPNNEQLVLTLIIYHNICS